MAHGLENLALNKTFVKKKRGVGWWVVVVLMCPNLSGISNGSLENRKESNILNKIASTFT